MSRIGNKVITVPAGVTVEIKDNFVKVKGPKGELASQFSKLLDIKLTGNEIKVSRPNDEIFSRKIHGTTRSLIDNMVVGVTEGFKKELEIHGVGYRAQLQGNKLAMTLGFSHPVEFDVPEGLSLEVPKNTSIIISGSDRQKVGEFAAVIRRTRKPEPYKGKGIRYVGEHVRRKAGKTAK